MQKQVVCHLMQQLQVRSLEIVLEAKGREIKKKIFFMKGFIFKTEIRAFCYGKITIKNLVNFSKTDYSFGHK
jgi:hypothetical protein